MRNETIILAEPTKKCLRVYPRYKKFYESFRALAEKFHHCKALPLPDIWVRDFLPLQNPFDDSFHLFNFAPRYANYNPSFTAEIRQSAKKLFPQAEKYPLKLDGGNIILSPDGAALCFARPRLFKANSPEQKQEAERQIRTALGAKKIIWLPKEPCDPIGHIDGNMQFLGKTLLVSDERADPYLARLTQKRISIIREHLPDLKIVFLPCGARLNKFTLSAKGIYVNFLETSRAVFAPQYGLKQDEQALKIMQNLTDKPIIPVECGSVAPYGGAVHCLTQVYKNFGYLK